MRLRHALCATLILSCLSDNVRADVVTDYATGRKGAYLKQTLQSHCGPVALSPTDAISDLLRYIYGCGNDTVYDLLSGGRYSKNNALIVDHRIVPEEWLAVNPEFRTNSGLDLFNLVVTTDELAEKRKAFPLYNVDYPSNGNDIWTFGNTSYFGDSDFTCLEPAEEYKGELARAIFYVVTIYPATLWTDWGETIFLHNSYPTLSNFAINCYMDWHRDHPVTASELTRNNDIENIQGNRNPFVDYPELAEHLWGDKVDEPFGEENEYESDDMPLRPTYKLNGANIYLRSPYIPDDASWKVDGKMVSEHAIRPTDLGTGKHELSYTSLNESGKLIITVEP